MSTPRVQDYSSTSSRPYPPTGGTHHRDHPDRSRALTLDQLLEQVRKQGTEILERPASAPKASSNSNETPKPSTWEYLIDSLVQAGEGNYIHLSGAITIMQARGWVTKSKTDAGTYRTVHSSTYKACRDKRKGHIAQADLWVDRTHAKDGLYALLPGVDPELLTKHSEWIEARKWNGEDAPTLDEVNQGKEDAEQILEEQQEGEQETGTETDSE